MLLYSKCNNINSIEIRIIPIASFYIDLANFYPPKPTVDHAFARWFLNDPNFGAMEDLQYTGLK